MPLPYESADLFFSEDGDFVFDSSGDLFDTYFDPLQGLSQSIRDRIKYVAGAWKLYPTIGVENHPFGMYDFEENIEYYENIIRAALTQDGLVLNDDLEINIISLEDGSWLCSVAVSIEPTPLNQGLNQRVFFLTFDEQNTRIHYY